MHSRKLADSAEAHSVLPVPRRRLAVAAALIAILALRLFLHRELYRSGFEAFDGDEFLRIAKAAWWTRDPGVFLDRDQRINWLPLPVYLTGIALRIHWNLLFVPRGLNLAWGIASLALMYFLAKALFGSSRIGLISALLLSVNPAHVWLSSTALSEIPYSALLLAFLLCFTLHRQGKGPLALALASLSLALANATRYEGWAVSGLFSAFLIAGVAGRTIRRGSSALRSAGELIAAAVPWIFPVAWLVFNHRLAGDAFSFLSTIQAGARPPDPNAGPSFRPFGEAALAIDPALAALAAPAWVFAVLRRREKQATLCYAAFLFLPLAAFLLLQGGVMNSPTVYIRYLASFFFIAYPAFAWAIDRGVAFLGRRPAVRFCALAAVLGAVGAYQVPRIFSSPYVQNSAGLKVGAKIAELRRKAGESARALVESPADNNRFKVWKAFAILVGVDDAFTSRLIWLGDVRTRFSLEQSDLDDLKGFLQRRRVGYIAVKSPALREAAENRLRLEAEIAIDGYYFYPCPDAGCGAPEP